MIEALRRRGHEVVLVEPGGTREAAFGDGAGLVAGLKRALPKAAYELLELAYGLVAGLRLLYVCWRGRTGNLFQRQKIPPPAPGPRGPGFADPPPPGGEGPPGGGGGRPQGGR